MDVDEKPPSRIPDGVEVISLLDSDGDEMMVPVSARLVFSSKSSYLRLSLTISFSFSLQVQPTPKPKPAVQPTPKPTGNAWGLLGKKKEVSREWCRSELSRWSCSTKTDSRYRYFADCCSTHVNLGLQRELVSHQRGHRDQLRRESFASFENSLRDATRSDFASHSHTHRTPIRILPPRPRGSRRRPSCMRKDTFAMGVEP